MKKLMSMLSAVIIILSVMFAATVNASSDVFENGDFVYAKDTNNIVSYIGDSGICEIPENAEVTRLYDRSNPSSVTKLIINKGVKWNLILSGELQQFDKLEEVVFKEGVTEIPYQAFEECKALKKVTIPSTVKKIGDYAFANCEELKEIKLPDGIESIGEYAFSGAKSLSGDVIIPDTVTYMGDDVFSDCGQLDKVHLSDNLSNRVEDDHSWFLGTKIKEINIPDSMLDNPPVLNADEITFNSDITVKIYNAVRESEWCKNKYLKGKTDKTIGKYDGFAIVENTVLRYVGMDKVPTVPEGVKSIGDSAFLYCDIDTVSLPKSLETISKGAFRMSTLKNIVIPQNIKSIGDNAFYDCPLLESVTVKGSPELGDAAFSITPALTEDRLVFENNSQALKEKVLSAGMVTEYNVYGFYEILNRNRERVGFKPVAIPENVKKQPIQTANPNETPKTAETLKPTETVKPTATALPQMTEVSRETDVPQTVETPMPTAAPVQKTLTVQGGEEIKISVDGKIAEFDAKPFIDDNGRAQVPVRAVSELVNCKVDWKQESQTAVIEKDNGDTVKITLGSDIMLMNDNQIKMDTAAQMKDDRTYIPVRFVAEALGLTVEWIE